MESLKMENKMRKKWRKNGEPKEHANQLHQERGRTGPPGPAHPTHDPRAQTSMDILSRR